MSRVEIQKFLVELPYGIKYVEGFDYSEGEVQFPSILKHKEACGTPLSHSIHIVQNQEQLYSISSLENFLVYPFISHSGTVFKCYCCGETFLLRPSNSLVLSDSNIASFDSQKPIPENLSTKGNVIVQPPNNEEIQALSRSLSQIFGVGLFGFDLIRSEQDGKLFLVDVNYFPDYRNIPDFQKVFSTFLKTKIETHLQTFQQ